MNVPIATTAAAKNEPITIHRFVVVGVCNSQFGQSIVNLYLARILILPGLLSRENQAPIGFCTLGVIRSDLFDWLGGLAIGVTGLSWVSICQPQVKDSRVKDKSVTRTIFLC